MDVLFLTQRMRLGFGVAVVVDNLSKELLKLGHRVTVGCYDSSGEFQGYPIVTVKPEVEDVRRVARALGNPVVVAQTSPFFELLPYLANEFIVWAWENGDPTPSLFPLDADQRAAVKRYKQEICYPRLGGVIVISEFLRTDIGYPAAHVVHLGCDHAPDLGSKGLANYTLEGSASALRIGTLMRLGDVAATYKGNSTFIELCRALAESGVQICPSVMGKGSNEDADEFRTLGMEVHLSSSDEEKWAYLRSLDVFVSCSFWEGFNLPLAEAQAIGTIGLAFDTGAHPEVSPFTFSSVSEMATFIAALATDRGLLAVHSRTAYHFVRARFKWRTATEQLLELLITDGSPRQHPSLVSHRRPSRRTHLGLLFSKALYALKRDGLLGTVRRAAARLSR